MVPPVLFLRVLVPVLPPPLLGQRSTTILSGWWTTLCCSACWWAMTSCPPCPQWTLMRVRRGGGEGREGEGLVG